MKKIINLLPILSLLFFAACSSDKVADEPSASAPEIAGLAYTFPSCDIAKDIKWVNGGDSYIEFEETSEVYSLEHPVYFAYAGIMYENGEDITAKFTDEIKGARIVGAWTARNITDDEIEASDVKQPATEVEIANIGKCKIADNAIILDLFDPSILSKNDTHLHIGLYIQGLKEGKDARGMIIITVEKPAVGNSNASVGKYSIDDTNTAGFYLEGNTLIVPAEGGKLGLRLDRERLGETLKVTSGVEDYISNKAEAEFFTVTSPMAVYSLSEKNSYLNIEFKPNTSDNELQEEMTVYYEPLESERFCVYGFAKLSIIQQAQ